MASLYIVCSVHCAVIMRARSKAASKRTEFDPLKQQKFTDTVSRSSTRNQQICRNKFKFFEREDYKVLFSYIPLHIRAVNKLCRLFFLARTGFCLRENQLKRTMGLILKKLKVKFNFILSKDETTVCAVQYGNRIVFF